VNESGGGKDSLDARPMGYTDIPHTLNRLRSNAAP